MYLRSSRETLRAQRGEGVCVATVVVCYTRIFSAANETWHKLEQVYLCYGIISK